MEYFWAQGTEPHVILMWIGERRFAYMSITQSAMGIVYCRDVEADGDLVSVSVVDPRVRCDTPQHYSAKAISWLIILVYSIGFPLWTRFDISDPEHL
jgi:hypothetical protein